MRGFSLLLCVFGYVLAVTQHSNSEAIILDETSAGETTPMEGHNMTINLSKVPDQKNRTNDTNDTVTWNGTWTPIGNTEGFSSPLPDKKDTTLKEVAAPPKAHNQDEPEEFDFGIDDWTGLGNSFGFPTPPQDGNVNKLKKGATAPFEPNKQGAVQHDYTIDEWGGLQSTFGFQTPPPDGNVNTKEVEGPHKALTEGQK